MHHPRWLTTLAIALLLATALLARPLLAQQPTNDPQVEDPPIHDTPTIDAAVTDLAEVLSDDEEKAIAEILEAHRTATGVQLAVLVVTTTHGEPIEDYAHRVASAWGGGAAGRDDGALFVLAVEDRRMRLEVGYGLEAQVPDATAKRMLAGAIPHLKEQRYASAIRSVVDSFVARTKPVPAAVEPPPEQWVDTGPRLGSYGWSAAAYALVFLLASGVGRWLRRRATAAETAAAAKQEDYLPTPRGLAALPTTDKLWPLLYIAFSGTAAGLLGVGWFHYGAAFIGLLAGWHVLWEKAGHSLFYLVFATMFGLVPAIVVGAIAGDAGFGILAAFGAQLFVTFLFSNNKGSSTSFSSSGSFDSSSSSWSSSSFGSSSSSSFGSSSFGSSSSSFGSSSSSFGSSSSSSSSDYSGGGGSFGGGGASSSW